MLILIERILKQNLIGLLFITQVRHQLLLSKAYPSLEQSSSPKYQRHLSLVPRE